MANSAFLALVVEGGNHFSYIEVGIVIPRKFLRFEGVNRGIEGL